MEELNVGSNPTKGVNVTETFPAYALGSSH